MPDWSSASILLLIAYASRASSAVNIIIQELMLPITLSRSSDTGSKPLKCRRISGSDRSPPDVRTKVLASVCRRRPSGSVYPADRRCSPSQHTPAAALPSYTVSFRGPIFFENLRWKTRRGRARFPSRPLPRLALKSR